MHLCLCVVPSVRESLNVLVKPELLADVEVNNSLTQSSTVCTYIDSIESVSELKDTSLLSGLVLKQEYEQLRQAFIMKKTLIFS